ncbi:MAG: tetratricopeptide repeat protein [Kiritimatiellia bacterium]
MTEKTLEEVPKKVRDLYNKGFQALELGNLDYAIEVLTSCVELEPDFVQARNYLRVAELQAFKKKGTGSLYRIAAILKALPTFIRSAMLLRAGKVEEAMVPAERLLRICPDNEAFLLFFAKIASAGHAEVAIQTLEFARQLYPKSIKIHSFLGNLYLRLGKTRSARQCFEKLCELAPSDPDALKALKDAMALDSMAADGWAQAAETGGTYREMIKDEKEAVILEKQAKAVKSESDADTLIEEAQKRIAAEPDNINHYRALTRLYRLSKRYDEAIATLEKALTISPGDPELDSTLSAVRLQKTDQEIAELRAAGKLVEAEKMQAERDAFALEDLQERVKRYPNELGLRYELGLALFERGQINEAIQQFQISRRSAKHRIKSLYYLALCFKQKKQYDLAIEQLKTAYSEVVRMDDDKKDICYELGELLEATGDRESAARYYKEIYQVDIGYRDIAHKIEKLYQDNSASRS